MFSKVTSRAKRHSVQEIPNTQRTEPLPKPVDTAPELLRWSDFAYPFPPVAFGGYVKYYRTHTAAQQPQAPTFCPTLSRHPEPSPSRLAPATSPLFFIPPKRRLSVIPEASMESMTPRKSRNLSITTSNSPTMSLRRRRRRLLRTPSIERDFAVHARHLFAPSISSSESESSTGSSLSHTSTGFTHSPSPSSDGSSQCDSSQSDFTYSGYPITPTTSIEGEIERVDIFGEAQMDTDLPQLELEFGCSTSFDLMPKRPESWSSFSTAMSSFSD
ncbi:hypothetical protein NLJ89_g8456 [Agrocybe chaxingu]|uniref:Uncharacterized protein n=1 Tax=Agrocybe chaxingu TaxID=84603 RepID=A0A9W8JVE5_9AGAR|nr:hypothetical protein NLJ89_g8456 [Agrocybe chaxingu]